MAGVGILAFVVSRVDFGTMTLRLDAGAVIGFLATIVLVLVVQLLSALRWRLVMGKEASPGLPTLIRITLIGLFFSNFLPTSVGGDAVRTVAVAKVSSKPAWAVSSVFFERFLGTLAMLVLLAAGALAAPSVFDAAISGATFSSAPAAGMAAAAGLVVLAAGVVAWRVLRRSERVRDVAREAAALWTGIGERPREYAAAFGVALAVQALYAAAWYQLSAALGLAVPPAEFLVFVPFVSIAAMLPVTISGIGVREGAWALLLAPYGIGEADAVAFSLLFFLAFLIVGALGGALFALGGLGVKAEVGTGEPALAPAVPSVDPLAGPQPAR